MNAKDTAVKRLDVQAYKKRVDYHRTIHRDLDDGALIALCETYGEEPADEVE